MAGSDALLDFNDYIKGGQALTDAAASVRALKSDVTAFSKAVDADGERIRLASDKIASAIKEIRDKAGNLSVGLGGSEADRQGVRDLIRDLGKLKSEQASLKGAAEGVAAAQRSAREAAGLYTKELKEQRDALLAATKAGDVEAQKRAALAIQGLAAQQREYSKVVRGTTSDLTAAAGSYNAANAELVKLRAEYRALGGALDGASPRAKELETRIQQLDSQLKASDKTLGQTYRNVGNYTQSILDAVRVLEQEKTALTAASTALNNQARATGLSAEQQDKLQKELRETDAALDRVNTDLKGYGVGLGDATNKGEGFGSGLKKYALTLGLAVFSFEALGAAASEVFRNNVEFSDQLADVRKTTGLTADEADRLATSLKSIDTRTSLAGLLDIAKVGGSLGIAKGDILDFTKSVDVAVQALGDDFSGGAEQIATELGKISNVFKKELGPDVATNLLAIGSAVNELGAEGAATAPFLTDVALRVGAVAAQTGVGLKNVLAYAAVLEETGSTSERAGTSLNRLFSTLSTKTKESFEIARKANPALTLKEFTRLVNTDFNGAIQLFLKGLNAGGKTTTQLSKLLATLKLDSGEAKSAIITLAKNTDLFAERQALANTQLAEATSLAEEAAIKNDNLAGSWEKLKNDVGNFFTSGVAGSAIKWLIDYTRNVPGKLAGEGLRAIGDGFAYISEKAGFTTKQREDDTVGVVRNIQAQEKLAGTQQKLLDSYKNLQAVTKRSSAQDLELVQLAAQLQAKFGTQEVAAIQKRIDKRKEEATSQRQDLVDQLTYYDKTVIPQTEAAVAKQQAAINKLGISPATLEQLRGFAASRLKQIELGIDVGAPTRNKKEIEALQLLITGEKQLAEAKRQRALYAAAVGKTQVQASKEAVDATLAEGDAEEATLDVFNKAARERAIRRKQELENQLAGQRRLIEETKKFQEEQRRLFEAKVINKDQESQALGGTDDTILTAEMASFRLRLAISKAASDEAVAQAAEELNAIKRKRKVTQAEILDAEQVYYNKRRTIALKAAEDAIQIEQQLKQATQDIFKNIDITPIGLDVDALAKADKDLDLNNERGLQRMRDRGDREKELREKRIADELRAEDQKTNRILKSLQIVGDAQQILFDLGAQRNAAAIANEEKALAEGLRAAGDNEELKLRLQEESDAKIAALKLKQAKADRAAALATIAINTAIAVTSVLRTGGGTYFADLGISAAILSGLVLASGVAQAAAVLAQPLPQYFKGREGGPAEYAMVAERGPELIQSKSGGSRLVEKPSIVYLEQHDSVLTAQRTEAFLRASKQGTTQQPTFSGSLQVVTQQLGTPMKAPTTSNDAVLAELRNVVQAVNRVPGFRVNVTDQGIEKIFEQKNNLTHRVNQKLQGKGR